MATKFNARRRNVTQERRRASQVVKKRKGVKQVRRWNFQLKIPRSILVKRPCLQLHSSHHVQGPRRHTCPATNACLQLQLEQAHDLKVKLVSGARTGKAARKLARQQQRETKTAAREQAAAAQPSDEVMAEAPKLRKAKAAKTGGKAPVTRRQSKQAAADATAMDAE